MMKSASYVTGGDTEDRVPYLKHSVLDMLVDNIFTVPPPGKRGSIYGEDLDGRYVKITPEEAAKEREYERGTKILKQPAIKQKMTKFVIEKMGFRYGVQLAWRAWVMCVWDTRVRKYLQRHPQYERRTPYKLLTQIFREWIELMREQQAAIALRKSWGNKGKTLKNRRTFKMKRILGQMEWGYIGPMLRAFRNLAFNVGMDMLEEIWTRAFTKSDLVKEYTRKAGIVCFDFVRESLIKKEAMTRWCQYYKAMRNQTSYEAPKENYSVDKLTKSIKIDIEVSRRAFDQAKEELLQGMSKTGKFQRQGTQQKLLTKTDEKDKAGATPPRQRAQDMSTPEKTEKQAGGGNVKFAR
jgi:hypothetical protein